MKFQCTICGYVYEGDSPPSSCPVCHNINFLEYDFAVLKDLNCSQELIEAMEKLKQTDIIEYELKMSQFRNQLEQKRVNERTQRQQQTQNMPKCPTCGSTNIEKISVGKKIGGSMLFGLFSSDVRNTMHCKDCGAKW